MTIQQMAQVRRVKVFLLPLTLLDWDEGGGGGGFAKYLKNGVADFHKTL